MGRSSRIAAAPGAAVLVGGVAAAAAAAAWRRYAHALARERAARVRSDFVARAGRLLDAPPDPQAMLEQIVRLAVPDMADLCIVDLVHDGELEGAAVFADDPATADALQALRDRYPLDAGGSHPVAVAARSGEAQLLPEMSVEQLRSFAASEEHLQLMLRVRYASAVVVPLVARGRTLGILSLLRFAGREPYTAHDLELATEIAGRAGLALDSARLFSELSRTEAQLEAVLRNLAAAVTVQAPDGRLVYVNQAAAELLGCASPDEVLATPPERLIERFAVLDELGHPYDFANLPGRHALAGDEPEPALVRSIVRATGEERWMLIKATAVRDAQGEMALAVNIIEDVTEARRVEQHQRFLAAASQLVYASLDIDVTLDKVAWAAVPELADWCCVDVPDERGELRRVAIASTEDERPALDRVRAAVALDPDEPGSPAHVLATGRPLLVSDVDDDMLLGWAGGDAAALEVLRAAGTRSAIVVPMTVGDRVTGLVTLGTSHSGRRLGANELTLAQELARRAGIAVENARVHAARSHIATTLQRSLLPPRLPAVPGVSVAARFRAAGETTDVGGDFYDLFGIGDAWIVVVGDVTGKGPAAAAITSLARYTMRTAATYERSPAAVLARLNAALAVDPDRRMLCTAVCARLEPSADGALSAVVACGGHPPPFLVSDDGAAAVGTPGPILGAFEDGAWEERRAVVAPGETLVLYTDGVTDTRGERGDRFGHDRLAALLADAGGLEAEEIAARIDEALRAYEHGPQRDDVALLVLRASALPAGAPLEGATLSGARTAAQPRHR